jgi:hypothetical protein
MTRLRSRRPQSTNDHDPSDTSLTAQNPGELPQGPKSCGMSTGAIHVETPKDQIIALMGDHRDHGDRATRGLCEQFDHVAIRFDDPDGQFHGQPV